MHFLFHLIFYHAFFDDGSSREDEGSQSVKDYTNAPANERPLKPQLVGGSAELNNDQQNINNVVLKPVCPLRQAVFQI
jgi:hypothetical protein